MDPWVLSTASGGPTEFLVFLAEQADVTAADGNGHKAREGALRVRAAARHRGPHAGSAALLPSAPGAEHRAYWVANMVWVRGDLALVEELAARDDVAHVYANPSVRFQEPLDSEPADLSPPRPSSGTSPRSTPPRSGRWVSRPGIVVGGQDTGYDWDHPALQGKYRGWNGAAADHDYNWHDAIHYRRRDCGADSLVPCDDHGHGTHTMGTMVGDDGARNQIGVAPGAKWIGCRNMNEGDGTPATYRECFQWFIAPTNLANQNPDPDEGPARDQQLLGLPAQRGMHDPGLAADRGREHTRGRDRGRGLGRQRRLGLQHRGRPARASTARRSRRLDDEHADDISAFSSRGPVTSTAAIA